MAVANESIPSLEEESAEEMQHPWSKILVLQKYPGPGNFSQWLENTSSFTSFSSPDASVVLAYQDSCLVLLL